jgi:hypothetical protein
MHQELRYLGLAPLFGAVGALATVAAWHLFAAMLLGLVPAKSALLWCLISGLAGPLVVLLAVWVATRPGRTAIASAMRRSASLGLGLVLAAEVGFYVPLGFFAIAFS